MKFYRIIFTFLYCLIYSSCGEDIALDPIPITYTYEDPIRSCGNSQYFFSIVDPDNLITDSKLSQLGSAIDAWNNAQSRSYLIPNFSYFDKDTRRIQIQLVEPDSGILENKYLGKAYQADNINACLVFISKNIEDITQVSMHEIGHCLGLGHNNNPKSVMSIVSKSLIIDSMIINQLSSLIECK